MRPKSQAVLRTKGRKPQFSGLTGLSISDSIQPYKKNYMLTSPGQQLFGPCGPNDATLLSKVPFPD